VSLLQPRGKFELALHPNTVVFKGKAQSVVLEKSNIELMLHLPHPPPAQGGCVVDKAKTLLFIVLKSAITVGKSKLASLALSLDNNTKMALTGPMAPLPEKLDGTQSTVVAKAMECVLGSSWIHPSPKYFTNSKGSSHLKAYLKANEGLLFLLPSGLVWTKPLQFIPASTIEDVDFNTAAHSVELLVSITDASLKSGSRVMEFAMIEASEQEGITKYFKRMSKKGRITVKEETDDEEEEEGEGAEGAAKAGSGEEEDDESSDEDDDYDPDKSGAEEEEEEEEGGEAGEEKEVIDVDGTDDDEEEAASPTKKQKTED